MVDDASLSRRLGCALETGDIRAHFQPIVSLSDERILGFEVLARWHDPILGVISPNEFIAVADEYGMLDELLDQLMREAFTAASQWPHDVFVGFNVSPSQLLNPELVTRVTAAATDCRFPLTRVHIEVTESALLHDMARAQTTLQEFINQGCMIAMDDFGTGYSSLTWLSVLPFSKIKIDAQFVAAMPDQRLSRKIVAAIIGLGRSLGLAVVAEGVETDMQADLLVRMGCELAQGYLYSPPIPADQVAALLAADGEHVDRPDAQLGQMSTELLAFQLADLYDSEQAAIAFTDPSGIVIAASATFSDLVFDSESPVVGQRIFDLIAFTPEMLAELRAGDLLSRTFPTFECPTPRGGRVLIVVRPVRDEDRELVGLSVVGIDVTARLEGGPAPADPLAASPSNITINDRYSWQLRDDGLVVSVDDGGGACSADVDASTDPNDHEDAALGAGWVDFVHPDDLGDALRGYAEAIATGRSYDVNLRLHGGDGIYQWFRVHTVPERDADGGTLRWRGHCELLPKTGMHASDSDQLAELLFSFETAPFTSWIADTDGTVTRVSAQGATPDRTRCTHIAALFDAVDAPASRARFDGYLARAEPFELTYDVRLHDGVTRMRCCAAPRLHRDGTVASWHGIVLSTGPTPRAALRSLPTDLRARSNSLS